MAEPKKILLLSLCFAILLVSGFYILLTSVGNGVPAISESDQTIYLQYARNMAQGHPYVYSIGDIPSSGSTTHLYIIVLAALFKLGFTGDLIFIASYALNAGFYLGIITCVWLIAKKVAPNILWLIMLLTVLSGQLASAALKQTDIGFFTLLTLGLFTSLLYQRRILSCVLIMACAGTRPEGLIFSLSFLICGVMGVTSNRILNTRTANRCKTNHFLVLGILGFSTFCLTLLINFIVTDHFQFMSVSGKGYFNKYPISGAVYHTLNDLLKLIFGFFGGYNDSQRQFYLLPYVSGVLGFAGILLRNRKDSVNIANECWFAMSTGGALLLIASSQFQGLSNDRYLAWVMPFWIIYICIGWYELSKRLKARQFQWLLAAFLILYQPVSIIKIANDSYRSAVVHDQEKKFAMELNDKVDTSVRFGIIGGANITYYLPSNTIYNLHGITSPDFFDPDSSKPEKTIDLLKNRPELLFDYWIASKSSIRSNPWIKPFMGEQLLIDADSALFSDNALCIWKTRWESLEGTSSPLSLISTFENMTLVDQIDVGYPPNEREHNYKTTSRLKNTIIPIIAYTAELAEATCSESGRIIYGAEFFTIENLDQDKSIKMVMRTSQAASGMVVHGPAVMKNTPFTFNSEMKLNIEINGHEVPCPAYKLQQKGFTEVVFEIPAQHIQNDSVQVMIRGDYISYGYWFYQ